MRKGFFMKNYTLRVAIVVGTRPEIIKMSPIIRECEKRKRNYFILHTGQHYSYNMDQVFFEQLKLPKPKYNLDVGSGTQAEQTGKALIGIEQVLEKEQPSVILVEGDTNTVLAGALAAVKMQIKIGHIEAGLRSYDRTMPEEINRVLTDHISDFCFAPTEQSRQTLRSEGVEENKIFITGNTIVDAVYQNLELATNKANVLERLGVKEKEYFLVTIHRQENVDNKNRYQGILSGLQQLEEKYNIPIIYPIHPRSRKKLEEFGLSTDNISLIDPQDLFGFLQLEQHARVVLTDSGGVQEETCILGNPCVTLRDNTERPETIDIGSNILAGTNPEDIVNAVSMMLHKKRLGNNPFGDGQSSKIIMDILEERL
jgi:UDP-N-acetylglucosamine 2-epimerase (non-hydrolysing)